MNNETQNRLIILPDRGIPGSTISFDFSTFHSEFLSKLCISLFQEKFDKGVSTLYLQVLFTAYSHFDKFLHASNRAYLSDYSSTIRAEYSDYLRAYSGSMYIKYTESYLLFLLHAPQMLNWANSSH